MAKLQQGESYVIHVAPSWVLTGRIGRVDIHEDGSCSYQVEDACWIERVTDVTMLCEVDAQKDIDAIPRFWSRPVARGAAVCIDDRAVTMAWPVNLLPPCKRSTRGG